MPLQPTEITIRLGPTYKRDIDNAKLGAATQQELQDTWNGILKAVCENPEYPNRAGAGDPIPKNNREIYKIRVADPSRNVGKSGSYRLIYLWRRVEKELVGLLFYHKSQQENVAQMEIDNARTRFLASN